MKGLLDGRAAIVTGIGEAPVAEGASVIVADNGASITGDGGDPEVARHTGKALAGKAVAFTDSVASPSIIKRGICRDA